jgi:hypothetical protein
VGVRPRSRPERSFTALGPRCDVVRGGVGDDQASIDKLLARGLVDDPQKMLSELARLGARLIIQRAVEEEFDAWLGRARYERRPEGPTGKRNGFRPRHVQTGEGELRIEIPQAREAVMPFVSKLFPKWHCKRLLRTDPLKTIDCRRVGAWPVDA